MLTPTPSGYSTEVTLRLLVFIWSPHEAKCGTRSFLRGVSIFILMGHGQKLYSPRHVCQADVDILVQWRRCWSCVGILKIKHLLPFQMRREKHTILSIYSSPYLYGLKAGLKWGVQAPAPGPCPKLSRSP